MVILGGDVEIAIDLLDYNCMNFRGLAVSFIHSYMYCCHYMHQPSSTAFPLLKQHLFSFLQSQLFPFFLLITLFSPNQRVTFVFISFDHLYFTYELNLILMVSEAKLKL